MKLFRNGLNLSSLAIGAGAVLLAPVVLPIIGSILKPIAKTAIKGAMIMYEEIKVSMAETKETIEDLAAEAKSEITHQKTGE